MTSEILRKLLVAGVAVAALSMAACQKPADKSASADSASTAAPAAAPAAAAPAPAPIAMVDTGGLPAECDAYFKKVDACVAKAGASNPMAGSFKTAEDSARKQWSTMTDKAALASACKQADTAFDQQAAALHCAA